MPKKILIGVPGFNGIVPEAQESFCRMIFRCGRDLLAYDFAMEVLIKREQFRARNQIVDAAIAAGCDYLLMLDDDMLVPPDLITRLLAHDQEVVGALYWQRGGAYHPVVMRKVDLPTGEFHARFLDVSDPVIANPGLHPVDIIGGGCMFFKVDVFRKLTPPYFWWEHTLGTDVAICTRLLDAGVQPYIDTSIELGHVSLPQRITRHEIPLAQQEMGKMKEQLWNDAVAYLGMPPSELESQMVQASKVEQRQERWRAQPRETWEQILAFYTAADDWHLLNLLYWAMSKHDQMVQWLLTQSASKLPVPSQILDLGPGIGVPAIPLAEAGHVVHAVELAQAPTLSFVEWRARHHGLRTFQSHVFRTPVPDVHLGAMDAVILLSMLDHCPDPFGTLTWAIAQLRVGGLLLCDYATHTPSPKEPQHLIRYDPATLPQWLREQGLEQSLVYPWMFTKLGVPYAHHQLGRSPTHENTYDCPPDGDPGALPSV
jgi:2-polyprenyl-3-methyl-5-hydroxy-6-metoxy-1,4-benzoquinol methylase